MIHNPAGIDFVAQADDPGFTGTVMTGGRFVIGTNDLFAPNGGFALACRSSIQVFMANAGAGLTLTLSTAGNYTVVLRSLLAVDPLLQHAGDHGAGCVFLSDCGEGTGGGNAGTRGDCVVRGGAGAEGLGGWDRIGV